MSDLFITRQFIKNRIKDVRSYIEPKIPKTVTIEEKPSLDEGKGQVHYREFRSVKLIPGEDKEGLKCGAGDPTVKDCPEPYKLFNKAVDRGVQMIDDAKKNYLQKHLNMKNWLLKISVYFMFQIIFSVIFFLNLYNQKFS